MAYSLIKLLCVTCLFVPLEPKSATSIAFHHWISLLTSIFLTGFMYIIQRFHYCFSYFAGMGTALSVTNSRSGWAPVSCARGTYLISCSHVVAECASGLRWGPSKPWALFECAHYHSGPWAARYTAHKRVSFLCSGSQTAKHWMCVVANVTNKQV